MYGLAVRWALLDVSENRRTLISSAATHQETQNEIQEDVNFQLSHLVSAEWTICL